MVGQLEESLLHAVDQALQRSSPPGDGGRVDLSQYLQLVRKLDEYLQDNTGKTLQSMEIAGQFGVSVRTLNNAVVAIRGLSLHRYTRLRRLWRVRQQLVQGAAAESLKAIALANRIDGLIWQEVHSLTMYQRPELFATKKTLANFGAFGFAIPWVYQDIGWAKP